MQCGEASREAPNHDTCKALKALQQNLHQTGKQAGEEVEAQAGPLEWLAKFGRQKMQRKKARATFWGTGSFLVAFSSGIGRRGREGCCAKGFGLSCPIECTEDSEVVRDRRPKPCDCKQQSHAQIWRMTLLSNANSSGMGQERQVKLKINGDAKSFQEGNAEMT